MPGDFVVPAPCDPEVSVVRAVGEGTCPPDVLALWLADLGAVVGAVVGVVARGEVPGVLSVVEVVDGVVVVVVVVGGPGLFARTELGEKGGFTFGFVAPNVQASTLPGGGS